MRRTAVVHVALGVGACAGITGLGDYAIDDDPRIDGGVSGEGGGEGGTIVVPGGIAISGVMLPDGNCGQALTQALSIRNANANAVPYEVTLATNDTFTLDGPSSGTIPALGTATVNIRALRASNGKSEADLLVRTNGGTPIPVHVSFVAHGPKISFDPATINLGELNVKGGKALLDVRLANVGDGDFTIPELSSTDVIFNPPIALKANSAVSFPTDVRAGTKGALNSVVTVVVPGNCGPTPTLTITGERTDDPITLTPASVSVGNVDCNSEAGSARVRLTNFSDFAAPFTTTGGRFTVKPNSDTLPGSGGGFDLQVTGKGGNAPGDFDDALTVVIYNEAALSMRVKGSVRGAVLAVKNKNVRLQGAPTAPVTFTNTGNEPICVAFTSDKPGFTVVADGTFEPNVSKDVQVKFSGDATMGSKARLTAAAVACPGASTPKALCKADQLEVDSK